MGNTTQPQDLPVIVQKAYDFCLWVVRKVESFPKSFRFTVGERMVKTVTELLMRLVDATYSRDKVRILTEVNAELNRLRFQLRMAKDLKLLLIDSYGYASAQVEEIGRMAGGWRKAAQ